jgi:hypothetical protein
MRTIMKTKQRHVGQQWIEQCDYLRRLETSVTPANALFHKLNTINNITLT